MTALALPTRRDEAFRYADIEALAALWPVPPADIIAIGPGEVRALAVIAEDGVHDFAITLASGARLHLCVLNVAQRYGRVAINATCHDGAEFSLGVVQIAGGGATQELVTTVTHVEGNATSRQLVRSVAADQGTVTYLGKVAVARGADGTDSEQDVKAMLLDRTATANAVPQLEIYADDVKCAHGCAIGELDANGLFYLQSRGLTPSDAKKLMLQAFVAGVFDGASDSERLTAAALGQLGALV